MTQFFLFLPPPYICIDGQFIHHWWSRTKEANRGRVTPSTEFTCYHVAYLIGLSHLCALLVYQCLIVPTNENVQMKQASAATFQNMELARICYRSCHLQFVFNLILLKVIVILQYLLVINLI